MTDELLLLHDLINKRTGLVLCREPGTGSFAHRIAAPFEKSGCDSFSDYYSHLRSAESGSKEWSDIVAAFSQPASPFYRHEKQTPILSKIVIPRLLEMYPDGLRIWSAACSTGEEPLSIAMALSECGWFDRARFEIFASDANAHAIAHARDGIYDERRANTLSPNLRNKYLTPTQGGWRVDPVLKGKIKWSVASLVNENEIADMASSHVIFCRNVFIYFSDVSIQETLVTLRKYMCPGGYLFTDQGDYYDSLIAGMGIFESERLDRITIWRKAVQARDEPSV